MDSDILEMSGHLALGSRLKRLAERMQADAGRAHQALGYPMQPSQFSLLVALDRYGPMTVGEAVERLQASQPGVTRIHNSLKEQGFTELSPVDGDRRAKSISLTADGKAAVARMRQEIWPHIEAAAREICAGPDGDVLTLLHRMETAMNETSLYDRIVASYNRHSMPGLSIVGYDDSLARDFYEITREWVEGMFSLEDNDLLLMEDPKGNIIDKGGIILFVKDETLGIIGTCALMPVGDGSFELTKMGVRASARGRKAGEFLLREILNRAPGLGIDELFLLTNKKCEAAIHLYEKAGFTHDAGLLARYGGRYERANVAMTYDLTA
ncbi:bifunctional helix-turn-helix transcriptional regulator/GNAT family N-acetyltransferase [Henriciella aquimarina]|uniref:bifunctional helix-turn-helix transcriptional regulator/GNAT family N-acetyltransferase n=1 Tax=Henriciella aquimarina TaxID=545261 RepID=UPI000A078182|nr:bifunctional helix-turn-helix transcriptional regulator/GNAT family N-acetyltransferase [Henriciella aquimarina]